MEQEQKKQIKKNANKLGVARYLSYIYGVNIKRLWRKNQETLC